MERYGICTRLGWLTAHHEQLSHKYRELPLIPVEEFLALKPELADRDENELMVARIEHERSERQEMENQRQDMLKRKATLIAENKKSKEKLANLDQELEKFIDVSLTNGLFTCNLRFKAYTDFRACYLLSRLRNLSRRSLRMSIDLSKRHILLDQSLSWHRRTSIILRCAPASERDTFVCGRL